MGKFQAFGGMQSDQRGAISDFLGIFLPVAIEADLVEEALQPLPGSLLVIRPMLGASLSRFLPGRRILPNPGRSASNH